MGFFFCLPMYFTVLLWKGERFWVLPGEKVLGRAQGADGGVTHGGGREVGDSSRAWKAGVAGHGTGSGKGECGFKPQQA